MNAKKLLLNFRKPIKTKPRNVISKDEVIKWGKNNSPNLSCLENFLKKISPLDNGLMKAEVMRIPDLISKNIASSSGSI